MTEPTTVGECDAAIEVYRVMLGQVSEGGRAIVWEQIDKLLEVRLLMLIAVPLPAPTEQTGSPS